ncbi:MAG: HAD hydrolase-like protein, partial [Thermoanaerobaculia bacterium]
MSERLRPAALVFDLDGTLVDSRRDIAAALNRLRSELGLPPLSLDQVAAMVGEGAKVLVRRALADWHQE